MSTPGLPSPAPRLLLGAAGTGTTWGVLTSLRERWGDGVHVVATDMAPAHVIAASSVADGFYQVAAATDPEFRSQVRDIVARERINWYLPTLDSEIVVATTLEQEGRLDGVAVIAPPRRAAEVCWDKLRTAEWLTEHGLPCPRTGRLADVPWDPSGLLVKPRRGIGSVGVERIDDPDRYAERQRREDAGELLAQELLSGPELTLDCFRGRRDGWVRVVCRERVETKAGVSTKARIFEPDEELLALATRIGEGLDLAGSFCFQVMPGGERGWLVVDVNPRTGAGTRLCSAVGVDFPAATLADAWGLPVRDLLPPLDGERWVVRQYREIVLR